LVLENGKLSGLKTSKWSLVSKVNVVKKRNLDKWLQNLVIGSGNKVDDWLKEEETA
jgi:hypothetical protein